MCTSYLRFLKFLLSWCYHETLSNSFVQTVCTIYFFMSILLLISSGSGKALFKSSGRSVHKWYSLTPIGFDISLNAYSAMVLFSSLHNINPTDGLSSGDLTKSSSAPFGVTNNHTSNEQVCFQHFTIHTNGRSIFSLIHIIIYFLYCLQILIRCYKHTSFQIVQTVCTIVNNILSLTRWLMLGLENLW